MRLLAAGANVSQWNKRGETPLSMTNDPLTIRSLLVRRLFCKHTLRVCSHTMYRAHVAS